MQLYEIYIRKFKCRCATCDLNSTKHVFVFVCWRSPSVPKSHWSDSGLIRQPSSPTWQSIFTINSHRIVPSGPTAHLSDKKRENEINFQRPLIQLPTGPINHRSDSLLDLLSNIHIRWQTRTAHSIVNIFFFIKPRPRFARSDLLRCVCEFTHLKIRYLKNVFTNKLHLWRQYPFDPENKVIDFEESKGGCGWSEILALWWKMGRGF